MSELLLQYGLPALFGLSFLAATLLPLGSEWLFVGFLLQGGEPGSAVLVATLGNSLGALTNYGIGRGGRQWLVRRLLRIDPQQQQRAEEFFRRYGRWSLLLAWLPVVGDPLCLVAGMLRISLTEFMLLVSLGKLVRYLSLAWLVLVGAG